MHIQVGCREHQLFNSISGEKRDAMDIPVGLGGWRKPDEQDKT
jgi:hypothetical protein